MKLDTYYPTLGFALDAVYTELARLNAEPALDIANAASNLGHVAYEQNRRTVIPLASYKGKPTRKACAVSLYRLPSGTYELVSYIS